MTSSEMRLYEILKTKKFSAQEIEGFIDAINDAAKDQVFKEKNQLATREDVSNIRVEMHKMKVEIIRWVVGLFIAQTAMIIALFLKK